jgi:hypothetical protein
MVTPVLSAGADDLGAIQMLRIGERQRIAPPAPALCHPAPLGYQVKLPPETVSRLSHCWIHLDGGGLTPAFSDDATRLSLVPAASVKPAWDRAAGSVVFASAKAAPRCVAQ